MNKKISRRERYLIVFNLGFIVLSPDGHLCHISQIGWVQVQQMTFSTGSIIELITNVIRSLL